MHAHIMLDLETMGNGSFSAITAVGAATLFTGTPTPHDIYKFSEDVSLQSSVDSGLQMDASTVIWWLQQSEDARKPFKNNEGADHLAVVLKKFSSYVDHVKSIVGDKNISVWGNGVSFDNVILSNAYKTLGTKTPWEFWQDRCYRTLKNVYPHIKLKRVGTLHIAVDDATSQVMHLQKILNKIGE